MGAWGRALTLAAAAGCSAAGCGAASRAPPAAAGRRGRGLAQAGPPARRTGSRPMGGCAQFALRAPCGAARRQARLTRAGLLPQQQLLQLQQHAVRAGVQAAADAQPPRRRAVAGQLHGAGVQGHHALLQHANHLRAGPAGRARGAADQQRRAGRWARGLRPRRGQPRLLRASAARSRPAIARLLAFPIGPQGGAHGGGHGVLRPPRRLAAGPHSAAARRCRRGSPRRSAPYRAARCRRGAWVCLARRAPLGIAAPRGSAGQR
jgi:hypothetical protein